MTENAWLIYGANGYTGELAAREAVRRGHRPVLAGRRREALEPLAAELGLEARVFGLDDPARAAAALAGMRLVLHCAGPFVRTSAPMVDAGLAAGADYLDITGEIAVFEAVLARHAEAQSAGRVLLPGVGFDVVPSDALAARLAAALPDASELVLAFHVEGGGWSAGTLKTMIEALPHSGAIRKDGRIVPVPLAWDTRKIPFGCGPRWAMTIAWGDVSTAFHSTGIANIRVYSGVPPSRIRWLRRLRPLLPVLGTRAVKRALQAWVARTVSGPDARMRAEGRTYLWGEVKDRAGNSATGTLELGEGYAFTAVSAVSAVERVLAGSVEPGSWTPSRALGVEFAAGLPGVSLGEVVMRKSGAGAAAAG